MSSQGRTIVRELGMFFALACLAAAALLPAGAMAKGAGTCTAGTTLRLSAPESIQGSLLLIEVESAKPLSEVQGDWGGRGVPLWREVASGTQRKSLLGGDLAKAPRPYALQGTRHTTRGGQM